MRILVKSRKEANKDSYRESQGKYVIISITSPENQHNRFCKNRGLKDTLYLFFHDVEDKKSDGIPMSDKDADLVARFVNKWKDKDIDELWIHCDAGISRSSGVAAAIMKYLTGDDSEIFDNPRYVPNSNCYTKTLNALMKDVQ